MAPGTSVSTLLGDTRPCWMCLGREGVAETNGVEFKPPGTQMHPRVPELVVLQFYYRYFCGIKIIELMFVM